MAKNEKFNEEDGVWRTIGGRKVFIRNGQSLSDAMKESGKFKSAKKKKKPEQPSEEEKSTQEKMDETNDKIAKHLKNVSDVAKEMGDEKLAEINSNASDYARSLIKGKNKEPEVKIKEGNPLEDMADDRVSQKMKQIEMNNTILDYMKKNNLDKSPIDGTTRDELEFRNWQNQNYIDTATNNFENLKKNTLSSDERERVAKESGKTLFTSRDEYDYLKSKANSNSDSNYRNKITDVAKNSKEDNVTLDVETGKPVNFDKGYSVSFQQSTDNYSDEEYAEKVAECRDKCDGKVYAGKYGGDAEASFHTDNIDDAKELMYKYNQESIYDWKHQTLIMNDKYDASKNQTNYKEKTNNDYMNDKIRKGASKNKAKDDLPKKTEIKTQGTSNRKEVSENIQAHILDYYDSPEDFIQQMDAMDYLPTKWHAGEELAKGGSYMVYYDEQRDFLDSLKINPKGKEFSDDRVFQTYTSLIGRESAKLYDRLKKNEYKKYLKQHPGSKMTFSEYKDMKKGGE